MQYAIPSKVLFCVVVFVLLTSGLLVHQLHTTLIIIASH